MRHKNHVYSLVAICPLRCHSQWTKIDISCQYLSIFFNHELFQQMFCQIIIANPILAWVGILVVVWEYLALPIPCLVRFISLWIVFVLAFMMAPSLTSQQMSLCFSMDPHHNVMLQHVYEVFLIQEKQWVSYYSFGSSWTNQRLAWCPQKFIINYDRAICGIYLAQRSKRQDRGCVRPIIKQQHLNSKTQTKACPHNT